MLSEKDATSVLLGWLFGGFLGAGSLKQLARGASAAVSGQCPINVPWWDEAPSCTGESGRGLVSVALLPPLVFAVSLNAQSCCRGSLCLEELWL